MTKLYLTPIEVDVRAGHPHSFVWQHRLHRITIVLKRWVVRVEWWRQEVVRQYYQVECEGQGLYEIYREQGKWFLERLYD